MIPLVNAPVIIVKMERGAESTRIRPMPTLDSELVQLGLLKQLLSSYASEADIEYLRADNTRLSARIFKLEDELALMKKWKHDTFKEHKDKPKFQPVTKWIYVGKHHEFSHLFVWRCMLCNGAHSTNDLEPPSCCMYGCQ